MRKIENLLAAWQDGTYALIWLDTENGKDLLLQVSSLPRDARQRLLSEAVAAMRPLIEAGRNVNVDGASMLIYPLATISPFIAELPLRSLIVIGKHDIAQGVPEVDADTAVRLYAAVAIQKVFEEGIES